MTGEEVRIEVLKRRVEALTQERNELELQVEGWQRSEHIARAEVKTLQEQLRRYRNAYHAQELELEMERSHSRILGERFDALHSQLPDAGSKVERFKQAQMRGERACL